MVAAANGPRKLGGPETATTPRKVGTAPDGSLRRLPHAGTPPIDLTPNGPLRRSAVGGARSTARRAQRSLIAGGLLPPPRSPVGQRRRHSPRTAAGATKITGDGRHGDHAPRAPRAPPRSLAAGRRERPTGPRSPRPRSGRPPSAADQEADLAQGVRGLAWTPSVPRTRYGSASGVPRQPSAEAASGLPAPAGRGGQRPATLPMNAATLRASSPVTSSAGIWPWPRARPFWMASSVSGGGGLSWSRFGPTFPTALAP